MKEIALVGVNGEVLSDVLTALLENGNDVDVFTPEPERIMLDTTNVTINRLDTETEDATKAQFGSFDKIILAYENDLSNADLSDFILRTYTHTVNAAMKAGVKQLIVVGGKDSEAFFTTELKHHPELNYAFTTTEGDFGAAVVSLL